MSKSELFQQKHQEILRVTLPCNRCPYMMPEPKTTDFSLQPWRPPTYHRTSSSPFGPKAQCSPSLRIAARGDGHRDSQQHADVLRHRAGRRAGLAGIGASFGVLISLAEQQEVRQLRGRACFAAVRLLRWELRPDASPALIQVCA